MARVGVITMNQVINYGSALQTYATYVILKQLGHDCIIIDYCYPNEFHYQHGAVKMELSWRSRIAKKFGLTVNWRMRLVLQRFLKKNVCLSRLYKNPNELLQSPPDCDIFISGSDQIWNPVFNYEDNSYLLAFVPDGKRRVAFSSSFSTLTLPANRSCDYKRWLSKYAAISVREKSGICIVKNLTGKNAECTLDPTLVLDSVYWNAFADKANKTRSTKPYILVYILTYAVNPWSKINSLLDELYETTGYDVIQLGGGVLSVPHYKNIEACSPEMFVNLMREASIVVTSSFHGTAFALNFGKPLVAFYDEKGDDRVYSLLKELSLESCGYEIHSEDREELSPYYDVLVEQTKLQNLRNKTIEFLTRNLY